MNDSTGDYREEVKKMCRKADMLCTAHSVERTNYRRWAAIVDILLMVISVYIVAMAFVDPALVPILIPDQWNLVLWIGMLSIGTFIISMLQIMVNWKARADAHHRSFGMYAEAKSKCIELLNANGAISREAYNSVHTRYDMATDIGIHIEDARFLKLKQKHLLKVEISKILDQRPAACVWWLRVILWWRDTFQKSQN
ncbi:MAG: hypothetical protein HOO92_09560 [Methylococcaceae bacterium]|nr:hypothetical protein [Methylococcaceae bacterium]